MLIEILCNMILAVLRVLLLPIQIEGLPEDVRTVFATLVAYLIDGSRVVCAYIHVPYISALLAFVIALSALVNGWRFIKWVLRKIPFINVE